MTTVTEKVSPVKKGVRYFFRLVVDSRGVTTTSDIDSFIGGRPMVRITTSTPSGSAGVYSGSGMGGHVSVSVTGDEGKFAVSGALETDGTWAVDYPATLANGSYSLTARLWKSVASYRSDLTVP